MHSDTDDPVTSHCLAASFTMSDSFNATEDWIRASGDEQALQDWLALEETLRAIAPRGWQPIGEPITIGERMVEAESDTDDEEEE